MKRIAFIYNSVPDDNRKGLLVECAGSKTVVAIEQALIQGGNEIIPINLRSPAQLVQAFGDRGKPDYALVIAEGFLDQPSTLFNGSGAALVRQTLTELRVPFSHSSVAAMELCRHKEQTYRILQEQGISCPWHVFLKQGDVPDIPQWRFPLFVKPAGGGNSIGIDEDSLVHNARQLARRIQAVTRMLGPVEFVAEQYLPGSEYTVGVLGVEAPMVLPAVAFGTKVRSLRIKRREGKRKTQIILPQEPLYFQMQDMALKTFFALGCADVIRIDIKADSTGRLYIIDVNGTPSLAPAASLSQMAAAAGLEYGEFVNLLLFYGLQRTGQSPPIWEQVAAAEAKLNALRAQQPGVA